ncbi:MAG TPA: DMT family transporter [Longimicrobiaceae bacterium]|nr:DMT family transporter [Longimicrobiaceae bacterium]
MKLSPVYVVLLLTQVMFATLPVAVKVALHDLSSPSLALLRVTGGALLFVALHRALVRERVRSRRDYARLAVYALLGVVANQLLYITALTMTTATAAQMLQTAGPATTLLIAILLGRESSSPGKWVGIGLAASGALYLVGVELGSGSALGNLLALLNVAAFSLYLVISRDLVQRYDPLTTITWVFVFGVAGMAPWGIPSLLAERGAVSGSTWTALAWIIVIPTVAGYYLNVWALQRVESSVVAVYVYLQPVVTALLAGPVLGERLSPRLLPAGALIFAGVTLSAWAGRRARRRAKKRVADQQHVEA